MRQSRVPTVRAGQGPVLARNDPLNIFGRQRQQTLLIAAADCRKKILHNLDILFDAHRNLSFSLTSSVSGLIGRFGTILLGPNHTADDRLLLLLEQILEDELTPSAAACVHQRATLVELSQLDGCEPELFGQIRHGTDRVLVVARQKDDPMAPLDDRIGSQGGRNPVIKTLHELSAGERLRNEGGGREAVQLLKGNQRVHRVDNRLAFPVRQGLRNLAMLPERDRQDDCVGLECIPQRLGDDRGSNRPSLRRQRLGRPAARDGHVDVFTGKGVGEGLTYLTESYNCMAHNASPIRDDIDLQMAEKPPSTDNSTPFTKLESSEARNSATAAISSGRPILPRGIRDSNIRFASSVRTWSCIGVAIGPGLSTFTRIFLPFSSLSHVRANERNAALLAAYTP